MKKTLFFTLAACSVLFCGCFLLTGQNQPQKTTVTVKAETNGHVYLVKSNSSFLSTIQGKNTGSIESVVSRAAGVENNFELSALHDDPFIRKQNDDIVQALASYNNAARSAGDEEDINNIGTGTSSISFAKGDKTQFHSFSEGKSSGGILEGLSHLLDATCYYAGKHCYVFGDDSELDGAKASVGINLNYENYAANATESDNSFFKLGKIFDACYELETSIIGDPTYTSYRDSIFIPCNQKVIIFVSDLYGDAKQGQTSGVVGYFYNGDMYKQSFLDAHVNIDRQGNPISKFDKNSKPNPNYKYSNEAAMLYVDSNFLTNNPKNVYTTLVHEFNHMINFSIKTLQYSTNHTLTLQGISNHMCDTWFTEMLAMVTEDMFCDYLQTAYEESPMARLPLFNLFYNYGFRNWDSYTVAGTNDLDSIYVSYANTYAFGAFLARNYGGVDLIKDIATNEYINKEAIDKALKKRGYSYEQALGNFPLILLNTKAPDSTQLAEPLSSEKYYFSLNRSAKKSGSKLYFNNIELAKVKIEDKVYGPSIFKREAQVDLGPQGFSIHYVGYNIKSFELTANVSDLMDYYLIEVY